MTTSDTGYPRRNAVLERLLAWAGWAPENLGDRLNELATSLNLRARVHRRTRAGGCTPKPSTQTCSVPRWPEPGGTSRWSCTGVIRWRLSWRSLR
jgi:hypothetical protein